MTLDLAQSLDLVDIGKLIGSLGPSTLLGIATYVLWSRREAERTAAEALLKAERAAYEAKLQAAQDKLDGFQDTRIKELSETLKALQGR